MQASIEISWLEEFIAKVVKSEWQVQPTLNKWIKKSIYHLESEAIPRTNVDTGTLRNSYKEKFWNLTGTLYNLRKYWIYVHEWTRFMKWNPFMTDTVKAEAKQVNVIMNKEMYRYLALLK